MTDDPRDLALERAFRDGLRLAADRTDVGVPLVARAQAGARTRRRRRWAVVGTVAAVVAVSGTAFALQSGSGPDRPSADRATTAPTFAPVTEWRAESWHNLTVDVPADWGWGTAPTSKEGYLCGGPGAVVLANGEQHVNPSDVDPWVGRPILLSDLCLRSPFDPPKAPYVWLGADLEPGTVDLGDGYTQETVEEFDTTLTVATQDPELRAQILGSVRVDTSCQTELPSRPEVGPIPVEGLRDISSARLCAYGRDDDGFDLVYATTLDQATAQALYHGRGVGQKASQGFCEPDGAEYVLITFSGIDGLGTAELTANAVIDPACRQIDLGVVLPLTDAGMELWSRNGVQAVLRAFIGVQG